MSSLEINLGKFRGKKRETPEIILSLNDLVFHIIILFRFTVNFVLYVILGRINKGRENICSPSIFLFETVGLTSYIT